MRRGERYLRQVAARVLQRYWELESGTLEAQRAGGGRASVFDHRVLNYRLDIEKVLKKLPARHVDVLVAIHRDGLTHADAMELSGFTDVKRPQDAVETIEVAAGRLFERAGLDNIEEYLS